MPQRKLGGRLAGRHEHQSLELDRRQSAACACPGSHFFSCDLAGPDLTGADFSTTLFTDCRFDGRADGLSRAHWDADEEPRWHVRPPGDLAEGGKEQAWQQASRRRCWARSTAWVRLGILPAVPRLRPPGDPPALRRRPRGPGGRAPELDRPGHTELRWLLDPTALASWKESPKGAAPSGSIPREHLRRNPQGRSRSGGQRIVIPPGIGRVRPVRRRRTPEPDHHGRRTSRPYSTARRRPSPSWSACNAFAARCLPAPGGCASLV